MTSCVDLKTHKQRKEIYFDVGVSGPKDGDSSQLHSCRGDECSLFTPKFSAYFQWRATRVEPVESSARA
jgi:hypothetical protein